MTAPFIDQLFADLRQHPPYRLAGLVELARLDTPVRDLLLHTFDGRSWPLLSQPQFDNLRLSGPWLFGASAGADLQGQHDFYHQLLRRADDAVRGWITSPLPVAELADHLSQAAVAHGPDGHPYLLRYHTETALPALHERRDLPAINALFAPIRSWWFPLAHPARKAWACCNGDAQAQRHTVPALNLDAHIWRKLAGDPLAHALADQLQTTFAAIHPEINCHGTRLGRVDAQLRAARAQGLTREQDLSDYVLFTLRNGQALHDDPRWLAALQDARDGARPLAQALRARMPNGRSSTARR